MNLKKTLANHKKWLQNPTTGAKANLSGADLSWANLSGANLHEADLSRANLSGADLSETNLRRADLSRANLSGADLSETDLRRADLHEADLSGADLSGADLDFSCLPLWCGGLKFKLDEQLAKQIMYHALSLCHEHVTPDAALRRWVNTFHHVGEVPKL